MKYPLFSQEFTLTLTPTESTQLLSFQIITPLTFTCSKSTIEIPENGVKKAQLTTKTISSVSNQPNILKQRKINQVNVKNKLTSMETFIDCGRFNEITSTKHTYQMRVYDSNWQHDVLTIKESRNVFNQLSKYQCVLENGDYLF